MSTSIAIVGEEVAETLAAWDLTRGPHLEPAEVATVAAALADAAPECSLVALATGDADRRRCYVRLADCLVSVQSADLSAVSDAVARVRRLAAECEAALRST